MTAGEYYRRELARRTVRRGLLGYPVFDGPVMVTIPPPAVLAECVEAPEDPAGTAWLRSQLTNLSTEEKPA